jgi:hypothetical protein
MSTARKGARSRTKACRNRALRSHVAIYQVAPALSLRPCLKSANHDLLTKGGVYRSASEPKLGSVKALLSMLAVNARMPPRAANGDGRNAQ